MITHPDLHERAFSQFCLDHEARIVDRLRERYAAVALGGHDATEYVEARRLDGLRPDPAWLPRYESPPELEMRRVVRDWLVAHGAVGDLDAPSAIEELSSLRSRNFEQVEKLIEQLRSRVVAWCLHRSQVAPAAWLSVPTMTVRGAIDSEGVADLIELADDWLIARASDLLGWPTGMPATLDLAELGLTADDLAPSGADPSAIEAPQKPASTINLAGRSIEVGTSRLADIARAAHETVNEDLLSQSGARSLSDAPPMPNRGTRGGVSMVVAQSTRMTDDERTAIGLVGEVVARAWLERRYQGVRWRSGYAALVAGDGEASDSWGFDLEVPYRNTSLYFEVKSLVDTARDITEFEMGESEVRVAQECAGGDRYRILLVTSVLEPPAREIFMLPSPFSKRGAGRFRVVGRGLRYRCQLDR